MIPASGKEMKGFGKMLDYLKRTNDIDEMIEIGKKIVEEKKTLYTPLMMEKLMDSVVEHIPDADKEQQEKMLFRSIYDYWAYGNNVDEEFYLHFYEKTDAEKREYIVHDLRYIYVTHLNSDGDPQVKENMKDKYRMYKRLEPYYRRDAVQIGTQEDFESFCEFAGKHSVFVVKPTDFYFGIGVHKVDINDFNGDLQTAFDSILAEGRAIKERHPSRNSKIVLEELIVQDESMAALHDSSVNAVRATAVRGKDGKVHIYHPWIKVGINGTFVASAAFNGFDAEIDPETGVVISDGYQESGYVYKVHPNSGITIKGFQIPKWDELVKTVEELMEQMPEYGYVGWDMVLTPKGWCVMEGNYSGEFMFQLINGRGYRKEFEELIGWSPDKEYWWQK